MLSCQGPNQQFLLARDPASFVPKPDAAIGDADALRHRVYAAEFLDEYRNRHSHNGYDRPCLELVKSKLVRVDRFLPAKQVAGMLPPSESELRRLIGIRLRLIRVALDLSQGDLAARIGMTVSTISLWEKGRANLHFTKIGRAAVRLGFSVDFLITGDLSTLRRGLADQVEVLMVSAGEQMPVVEQDPLPPRKAQAKPEVRQKRAVRFKS